MKGGAKKKRFTRKLFWYFLFLPWTSSFWLTTWFKCDTTDLVAITHHYWSFKIISVRACHQVFLLLFFVHKELEERKVQTLLNGIQAVKRKNTKYNCTRKITQVQTSSTISPGCLNNKHVFLSSSSLCLSFDMKNTTNTSRVLHFIWSYVFLSFFSFVFLHRLKPILIVKRNKNIFT